MRRKKINFFPVFFFLIFGVVGLAMLIGGLIIMKNTLRFQSTAVDVTGVITDITAYQDSDGDINHHVRVSYSYNGRNLDDVPLDYYSSGMYEGKEVSLSVDPNNPGHMISKFGSVLSYGILLGMGLIFAAVGFIPLIRMLLGYFSGQKLVKNGQVLHPTVERIDINPSVEGD